MATNIGQRVGASVLAVSLAVPCLLMTGSPASASCAPPDPPAQLAEADAAFVGTFLGRGNVISQGGGETGMQLREVFFDVEEWIKGDLGGPRLTLASPMSVSVELALPEGSAVGVLVYLEGGLPTTSGCSVVDPAILRSVVAPASTPDGSGPPALLVGGDFARSRVVALDTHGRVVAYGAGEGDVSDIDVCPGGQRIVESFWSVMEGGSGTVVRDGATLAVLRELDTDLLPGYEGGRIDIECLNDQGDAVGFIPGLGVAALDAAPRMLWNGTANRGLITTDRAIVIPEGDPFELHMIDLADGDDVVLHRLPRGGETDGDVYQMSISPSGDRLALTDWVSGPGQDAHTLRVFRLADGAALLAIPLPPHSSVNTVSWVDDATLLTVAFGTSEDPGQQVAGTVRLLSASDGTELARWTGWDTTPLAVTSDMILGMQPSVVYGGSGRLVAAPLHGGRSALVRQLDGPSVSVVVPLPALDGAALLAATTPLASAIPSTDSGVPADGSPTTQIAVAALVVLAAIGVVVVAYVATLRRRTG